jgi:hypothetical protein
MGHLGKGRGPQDAQNWFREYIFEDVEISEKWTDHVGYFPGQSGITTGLFPSTSIYPPVSTIPPLLHTFIHLNRRHRLHADSIGKWIRV